MPCFIKEVATRVGIGRWGWVDMEAAGKMGDVEWQGVKATGGMGNVEAGTCGDS